MYKDIITSKGNVSKWVSITASETYIQILSFKKLTHKVQKIFKEKNMICSKNELAALFLLLKKK